MLGVQYFLAKTFPTIAPIIGLLSWLYQLETIPIVNSIKCPVGSNISMCLHGVRFV